MMREIDLNEPLLPEQGFEGIKIGENIGVLRPFMRRCANDWTIQLVANDDKPADFVDYVYKDSVYVRVAIYSGIVIAIRVENNFFGSFYQDLGVGSLVTDIKNEAQIPLEIKDTVLKTPKFKRLTFHLDYFNQSIANLEDVLYTAVQAISVRHIDFESIVAAPFEYFQK